MFADEPTGNLDSAATVEILKLLENLHASELTIVVVTHDERIAATADRMISMRDGVFVDETRLLAVRAEPSGIFSRSDWRTEMRGRALLIYRLVASSLRRRPVEVVVTVAAIAAATTTLMVGLALRDVSAHPYQSTRALTAGPNVAAMPSSPSPEPGAP